MWVLPVPEFPRASTFSRLPIHSQRANSTTSFLFSEGIERNSYVSRLLLTGNRAAWILLSVSAPRRRRRGGYHPHLQRERGERLRPGPYLGDSRGPRVLRSGVGFRRSVCR